MTRSLLLALLATPAVAAEPPCAPRDAIAKSLGGAPHWEALTAVGETTDGGLLEIWTNDRTGTWTVLLTTPDGRACLISAGQRWWQAPPGQPT